ncbi:MAG: hypothetical protein KAH07_08000, partial [Flavobacteriaceae bacterium]|nr:hypothetical protein [Flavobacteriaceae bacterium]
MKQHYNNPRFTSKLPILFIGIFILISSMSEVYAFVDSSTEADSHLNATEVLSNSVMEKTNATIALTPSSVSITCGVSNSPVSPYVANAGGTYTIPNASLDATATSSDGGAITIVNDFNATSTLNGAVFPIGANVVEWTATNLSSGDVVTCVQTINVVDNGTGPTANCKNVTVTLDPSGNASITLADIDNGSTGNIVLRTLDRTLFNCSHVGSSNTVTLTVTDSNGNKDTCTATVTVKRIVTSATVSVGASPSTTICPGTTVTFTATPSIAANVHYRWFIDGAPAGTDSDTFSTTSLNDKDKVTVEIRYGACNYLVKTSAPFEANVYPSTAVTAPT